MAESVHDVAAAIIERHHPIDPLKLQKLVYFAAGEFISLANQPMFPEPVEAWDYGPVVYDLYDTYRSFEGERAILEPDRGNASALNDLELGCIESALAKYGEYSGAKLIDLSHAETAWRESYVPGQRRTVIPNSLIRSAFREKAASVSVPDDILASVFGASADA